MVNGVITIDSDGLYHIKFRIGDRNSVVVGQLYINDIIVAQQ